MSKEIKMIAVESEPVKTAKQLEKETKKQAKLDKLQQKLEKKSAVAPKAPTEKKEKKKEVKDTVVYDCSTAPGEKKNVNNPMPSAYSPQYVEAAWYSWWEKEGFFMPEYGRESISAPNNKGNFTIIIPPPNVTGSLHLGHALTNAIQDSIVRWHRMNGKTTLWNPGCDHAGIATQVVVEKKLWREERKTRHDIGRDKFIENIWKWKNEKGDRIYMQMRTLGASMDWTRAAFTMDPKLCKAVTEAFVRLHEDGTIYRHNRLVNWSCALKSAISDIEVDKVDVSSRTLLSIPGYTDKVEFGVLTQFKYRVVAAQDTITVATTRVETMLGDTGVAVHPDDERYKHLHGKFVQHPFCDRKLPIVTDTFVERDFGTGAVKITPAHDPNDYECGLRNKLPFITVLTDDGRIQGDYGEFTGMKRFDARIAITDALKRLGLYVCTDSHQMVVPICSRSKDIVEPMLKPQWYLNCDEMAKQAVEVVASGALNIIPEMHTKTWHHWMAGIRDWCISRQLWWGHRIPAWFATVDGEEMVESEDTDNEHWISGRSEAEALRKAAVKFHVDPSKIHLKQDEDVLDTWFSSGLFPFSIFGWPDDTEEMRVFYPSSLLETGHDILFFWVARMVFFGTKLLGKLPFKEVYLHPIIRDAHGRKMSKSLGNVIDPIDVINGICLEDLHKQLLDSNLDPKEVDRAKAGQKRDYPEGIPECGADALRFALCAMCSGRDINLDILRVQGYRFFCNKIWNATKFALTYLGDDFVAPIDRKLIGNESPMDLWMLSRLSSAVADCNKGFENYDFPLITTAIYNVWLYDLCDVYLEHLKPILPAHTTPPHILATCKATLYRALDVSLLLLAPFMPFITEELYQRLPRHHKQTNATPSIAVAAYPAEDCSGWRNATIEGDVDFVLGRVAKAIRAARSVYNVPNKTKTQAFIVTCDVGTSSILTKYAAPLQTLSYCESTDVNVGAIPVGCSVITVSDKCDVHLLLKGLIDPAKELEKMSKKVDFLRGVKIKLGAALDAPDYATKVPRDVQDGNEEKLSQTMAELERLESAMVSLKLMN